MEEKKNNALEKVEKVIMSNTVGKKPYPEVYGVNVVDSTQLEPVGVIMDQKEDERKSRQSHTGKEGSRKEEYSYTKGQKNKYDYGNKEPFNKRKGFGAWRVATIVLGVLSIGLAVALGVTNLVPSTNDSMLESSYGRAFHDAVKQVDNVDLNLSKILVTKDTGSMQKYLVDTAINSELCENDLQELPLQDENKYYTTKLVNQIGDFAKYLNNKIIDGKTLTEQDYQMLNSLYKANQTLKSTLYEMADGMGEGFNMTSIMGGGNGNLVVKGFNDLENLSVDFPKLIYDGPFSDGQESKEMKGLIGGEIDCATAKENFKKIFADYSLEEVACDSQVEGGVEGFNVSAKKDNEMVFAQFTKKGGKLILYSYSGSCKEVNISEDQAIKKGQEFLDKLDIKQMKAVWINLANNVYTINFAGQINGVVIYPDLIKIRVCAETGMVIGLEAKSYYTNHTERQIETPRISEKQARSYLYDGLNVENVSLAIVPVGNDNEVLCYEFFGEHEGSQFYAYISAKDGKQVEMFKVIESTEGKLLN